MIKISVIAPVLNEVQFIGYSIMAAEPYVHEWIYALDEHSNDGTRELLAHIKERYVGDRLVVINTPNFHPHDTDAYNAAFNDCVSKMTGDAAWFLHPDMIVTGFDGPMPEDNLAWWTTITSYARDFNTVITKGRADRWKNIHRNQFGLHYAGAYGSQNEDFYHRDITGKSYKHYGTEFSKYPFRIANSGFRINHYCEAKPYKRRLEKMKLCLKTLAPEASEHWINESAINHPRVTLEPSSLRFGEFCFQEIVTEIPSVFDTYKKEFEEFQKEPTLV